MRSIYLLAIGSLSASLAFAQVAVEKQGSPDQDGERATVQLTTMDRQVVPLQLETKTTKVDDATTRTESLTRTRLADGGTFVSERAVTVTENASDTVTRRTTQVTELDRQGQGRVTRQVAETITKTEGGAEQRDRTESRRTASGSLVPARRISETVSPSADGTTNATRLIQEADVNGRFVTKDEVRSTTTATEANTAVTSRSIRSYDHREGRLAETAREVTTVRSDGPAVKQDTVRTEPVGSSWVIKSRSETTETTAADGATRRETVQYAPPQHAQFTPASTAALQPVRKIVEQELVKPDGTRVLDRQVFRRDVNGSWVPEGFSTMPGGNKP